MSDEKDAAQNQQRFGKVSRLLGELKSNPIVATLRAIGFEALCALILRSKGYEHVELGRVVPWQQTTRDVDVFGLRDDKLRIIECKAYHRNKSISSDEVRKFFTQTVPSIKQWLRSHRQNFTRCTAEIWTTGRKGKDAGDTLYRLQHSETDRWAIRRIEEIKTILPESIKNRSLELLNTIAIAEIDGSTPEQ